jgi:WD40 repeat protein
MVTVAFNATGEWFASAHPDGLVKIWQTSTCQVLHTLAAPKASEAFATSVPGKPASTDALVCHPHQPERLVGAGADGHLRFWDLSQSPPQLLAMPTDQPKFPQPPSTPPKRPAKILGLAYSSSSGLEKGSLLLASSGTDKIIQLWREESLAGPTLTGHPFVGHTLAVNTVDFHPHRPLLASGSDDTTVRIWDCTPTSGAAAPLQVLRQHTWPVRVVAFSPTGNLLATAGTDRTIQLWDTQQWRRLHTLSGHAWPVSGLAWLPSPEPGLPDLLLSASWDTKVKVWHSGTGQELLAHSTGQTEIHGLALHPKGDWLITGHRDGRVHRWSIREFLTKL